MRTHYSTLRRGRAGGVSVVMAIVIALLLLSALIVSFSGTAPAGGASIQPPAPGQSGGAAEGGATATPAPAINGRGVSVDVPNPADIPPTSTPLPVEVIVDTGEGAPASEMTDATVEGGVDATLAAPVDQPTEVPPQFLSIPAVPLTVMFTTTSFSGVSSLTTTFTDATTPLGQATTYAWEFGNGQTATTAGPHIITYTAPGVYTVVLTASDGYTGGTYEQQVVVFDPGDVPVASFVYTISPPDLGTGLTQVCFDPFLTTGQIDSYAWYFSFVPGSGAPDFTLTAPTPVCYNYPQGDFLASLIVTGAMGRSSTRQELISVPPLPTLTPTFTPTFTPSPTMTLTPEPCTVAVNDEIGTATLVTGPGTYQQSDIFCATSNVTDTPQGNGGTSNSVWFSYTPVADITITLDASFSSYFAYIGAYDAGTLSPINGGAGSLTISLSGGESVLFMITADLPFQVVDPTTLVLTITEQVTCTPVVNDAFSGAIGVADGGVYTEPLVACATVEAPTLACGSTGSAQYSTWFSYTAGATDEVFRVNTFGSTYDTVLEIFDAADTLLDCNDDSSGLQSSLVRSLSPGESIKIRVSAYDSGSCDPLDATSCTQVVNVSADPVTACGAVPNDEASGAFVVPPLSTGIPYINTQTDINCATTNAVSPVDPVQDGSSTRSVWYAYTVGPVDEDLFASTFGASYSTALGVYTLSGGVFTPEVVNPFGNLNFTAAAGTTYYFQVTASDDSQINQTSDLEFYLVKELVCAPIANDEAAGAFPILAGQTLNQSSDDIRCATIGMDVAIDPDRTCAEVTPYNSVWYAFTPNVSQVFNVTTNGSQYDTVLTLHDSASLAETACDDNGSVFYPASSLTFNGTAGTTYYLRVTAIDEFECGGDSEGTPESADGPSSGPVFCGLTLNVSPELIAPTATPFGSLRASFTPSVFSGVGTTPVCFTDTSITAPPGNTIVSWNWDFGGGQTSTEQNPCVNFTTVGTFTITLNVTSSLGLSGRASNTVRVIQLGNNQTFFVIQQPTATPSPTVTVVPDTPTPFATNTVAPTPIATATPIPPEGRFINSAICGGNSGGGGFPAVNVNPCGPDISVPRPPNWQPPTENPAVVIESEQPQCPALIYHTNRNGGWELFRLGDIPNVPNAPDNLSQGNDPLYSSFSPSLNPTRGLFVFTTDRDGNWELYLGSLDGRPPVRLTYNRSAADLDPEWSPRGDLIAYETTRDGNWNIYTVNVNTGEERQITSDPDSDVNASFAPDGLRLLFVSDRDGLWQIYEADLTTGAERRISDGSGDDFDPVYSPDGTRLLFRSNRDGVERVYTMNADGTGVEAISPEGSTASNAVWSANSRYVAFQALVGGDQEIFVYDTETGETRQITDNDVDDQAPTWRCDSTEVVFMSNAEGDNDLYQVNALPMDADPVSVPAGALRLTNDPAEDQYPVSQPGDEAGSRQGRLPIGTRNR